MEQYTLCNQICQSLPIPRLKSLTRDTILKTLYVDIALCFSKPVPPHILPSSTNSSGDRRSPPELAVRRLSALLPKVTRPTEIIYGEHYHIIPSEIRDYIHTMNNGNHCVSSFILPSGRLVSLYVWFPQKNTKQSLHKIITKIYKWLLFLDSFVSDSCSRNLTIYLYLTKLCKKLPNKQIMLDANSINNAFTYPCKPSNEIYIYREEEWFKVFIHETMHALGLDFSKHDFSKISEKIHDSIFSGVPSKNIDLTEAYTETWAEILIILINVYYATGQHSYTRVISQIVEKSIYYEKVWSLIQCIKVLNHQNISYQDLLLGQPYRENTSAVFAYFVLKAICIFHMEEFLEWSNQHNITGLHTHIFTFKYSIRNIQSFGDFIIHHASSQLFINSISKIEYHHHDLGRSLRMSLWG
jgi:hypothetical protein